LDHDGVASDLLGRVRALLERRPGALGPKHEHRGDVVRTEPTTLSRHREFAGGDANGR
jgi:hypothetical protein